MDIEGMLEEGRQVGREMWVGKKLIFFFICRWYFLGIIDICLLIGKSNIWLVRMTS
jgi:hypothetical protein